MTRRTRTLFTALAVPTIILTAGGCSSCRKKPPPEEVKRDKPRKNSDLAVEPSPPDLALEMVFKDPEGVIKHGADSAGFGKEIGPSPYDKLIDNLPDEKAKKVARALDPHGAISLVVLAKVDDMIDESKWNAETIQAVGAAHLKDPELASAAMTVLAKTKGDVKSYPAKSFEGTIYEIASDKAVAITGDIVLAGDGAAALEKAGRYAAYLARKGDKQEHDLTLRIPTTELEAKVKSSALSWWATPKAKRDIPPSVVVEIDKLLPSVLTALGEAGDVVGTFDVTADDVVMEQKMSAKGSLSKWLSGFPSGDASPMLAMPKGEGAVLYRFADGLGPIAYALVDEAVTDSIKKSSVDAADGAEIEKQARALGGALGHELVYSGGGLGAMGGMASSSVKVEYFSRVELSDPGTAKTSLVKFRELFQKYVKGKTDPKLKVSPYKKFGAEGETIDIELPTYSYPGYTPPKKANSTLVWAIRGSYLFVDVTVEGAPKMFDDGLDPAAKGTLAADPSAKAKVASFPQAGVIEAGYGDLGAYMRLMASMMGAPLPATLPPLWGYATVSADGVTAREQLPIALIGGLVRAGLMLRATSASKYPAPMGTPIPPSPGMPPELPEE